jgi:hypothetical protein
MFGTAAFAVTAAASDRPGAGAAIGFGFASPVRMPNCFSSWRSARRRIASGVIAVSGVCSRNFR